jgi:hypothetical protein
MTPGARSGQNLDFKDFRSQSIQNKELRRRLWASRQPLAVLSRITPICGAGKVGCHSGVWNGGGWCWTTRQAKPGRTIRYVMLRRALEAALFQNIRGTSNYGSAPLKPKPGLSGTPAPGGNILGHDIFVTDVDPAQTPALRLGAAWLKGMVRKLRKCLDRGLSSVRTSAKAACQHSPRAK